MKKSIDLNTAVAKAKAAVKQRFANTDSPRQDSTLRALRDRLRRLQRRRRAVSARTAALAAKMTAKGGGKSASS